MKERAESKMSAKVWDRAPIAYWDRFLEDREPHLFSIPRAGGELIAITRQSGFHLPKSEYSDSSYDISPDGSEAVFVADTDASGVEPNLDLIRVATCGCKPPRNLTETNRADDGSPAYSPDGKWLAYTAQAERPIRSIGGRSALESGFQGDLQCDRRCSDESHLSLRRRQTRQPRGHHRQQQLREPCARQDERPEARGRRAASKFYRTADTGTTRPCKRHGNQTVELQRFDTVRYRTGARRECDVLGGDGRTHPDVGGLSSLF
ncbi:MAG: hypothetical protein EBT81_08310 [Gammaproteobacteria bacterium]|nr:hypothetical protein [Gammaproteobacteria bacterium]